MKKLIFLFAFALTVSAAVAQGTVITMKKHFPNTDVAFDTVTNTGTNFLTNIAPQNAQPGGQRVVSVVWTATKTSGTVAGTVTLQASHDGTTFIAITAGAEGTQTGAFTATNVASQTTTWTLAGHYYKYYRVTWTGTGTMVATQAATLLVQ